VTANTRHFGRLLCRSTLPRETCRIATMSDIGDLQKAAFSLSDSLLRRGVVSYKDSLLLADATNHLGDHPVTIATPASGWDFDSN
jgi:hypothetical protein